MKKVLMMIAVAAGFAACTAEKAAEAPVVEEAVATEEVVAEEAPATEEAPAAEEVVAEEAPAAEVAE